MTPLTRKENYLNEIVGWGNTAPEKPLTPEEFFFAAILGEAVQAPDLSNASRYELFLAKIAGYNVNISPPTYTSPRLEFFLAKAAGMDVVTPVPLTKEEIFWANYKGIEQIIEGVPPLTFNAIAGTLKNYRIYGNTVGGESVGDRTANLFDGEFLQGYWALADGAFMGSDKWICTQKIPCKANTDYTFTFGIISRWYGFAWYDIDGNYIEFVSDRVRSQPTIFTATSPANAAFMGINIAGDSVDTTLLDIHPSDITDLMLNSGSTALPYEPYGYKVPVTVEGINILPMSTTPISTDVDDFHCEYDGTGTITLTTDKDNAVLSNFSIPLSEDFIIPVSVGQGGDGCVQFNNSIATSSNTSADHLAVNFYYNSTFIDSWGLTTINRINSTYSSMGGKTINQVAIDIKGIGFSTNRKIVIRPAFILNTTEQVSFEPYHAPVTTPIYLPEQIKMVGEEAEYVDYAEQKLHRIGADDINVILPALPTLSGTNTLSVETAVQPSKVMVKIGEASAYKVRYYVDDTMARVETVSDGTNAQGFTPTKASTAQYDYTFMGWSTAKGSTTAETGVLNDITADKSLYAVFSQSLRTFTVYFYNDSTLLQTAENVQYGGTATYTGETPTKDGFTFSGWQPSNVNITADTSCYAQFVEG